MQNFVLFFPHKVFIPLGFTSKVLMRHIRKNGNSRGSVINERFLK